MWVYVCAVEQGEVGLEEKKEGEKGVTGDRCDRKKEKEVKEDEPVDRGLGR